MSLESYIPTQVEPSSCALIYNGYKLSVVKVIVEGGEYDDCMEFSDIVWTKKKKPDAWNTGVIGKEAIPLGLCGQMGFSKITNTVMNFEYLENGDHYDTIWHGWKEDTKTQCKLYDYGLCVRFEKNGYLLPLSSDIYVIAYGKRCPEKKQASVYFIGSIWKEELITKEKQTRRKTYFDEQTKTEQVTHWTNYVVPYSQLYPLGKILKSLKS